MEQISSQQSRPDICHEYHELYLWRKNCHVEKFQLSMYKNCGDIENFSTCEEIFNFPTIVIHGKLKFLHKTIFSP